MYERAGFTARDRWGEYADAPHSRCFEKRLDATTSISNEG